MQSNSILVLPDVTTVDVKDSAGNMIFSMEALFLDEMLAESQEGVDLNVANHVPLWLPNFTRLVNSQNGTQLSQTHCLLIAQRASQMVAHLKKTAAFSPESLNFTESIPSNSEPMS